jgi:hypothetical protein
MYSGLRIMDVGGSMVSAAVKEKVGHATKIMQQTLARGNVQLLLPAIVCIA